MEIIYQNTQNNPEVDNYLHWWSARTAEEPNMIFRTPEFFKENLVYGIFAVTTNKEIVGAAGLIHIREFGTGALVQYRNLHVAELISNYVNPLFRNAGIASTFVSERIQFARQNNSLPVSVTKNEETKKKGTMTRIFENFGAKEIENFPEYSKIRKKIRHCNCGQQDPDVACANCPLKEKKIWVF